MPRTRPELNRQEKVAEILAAGERRLRDGGFDALSISGIARDLGLAQNAIYWYFPSRAELFVAVLRRILEGIAARKPRHSINIVERALWFTDQFAPLYNLRPAMQEQARESADVAQFVRELDNLLERMLTNLFRERVLEDDLPLAIDSFRAAVTGAYAQGLSRARRRKVLAYTLDQLLETHAPAQADR
jgi:AcrR family transcriptional regulator